ncbi:pilus assembly protein PapD [Stenotrophomonas terrae]|uniref:Pilus assembly protein PapD n=1 Tax=Stenotrophomonas terrae TaxID=405446 RepID=A0A0R0CHT7_9GAMM|nr:fimbria/pilus periplasmic chaperone [Stenotrophomonas terrae]KRG69437.1 pilus assembly protein PapD [Stenotrophomonas terrae]
MKPILIKTLLATALMLSCGSHAIASVVIGGTRVIYPAQSREITVQLSNIGEAPSLVQAWIDSGDPEQTAENADAPFMLTPPIARVEPGRNQALRVMFAGSGLPTDRESLYWLNVLDMAPSPKNGDETQNYLQVAFRSRVKLFYRPEGLPGTANEAPTKLRWSRSGTQLHVDNPTPYYVTFAEIHALSNGASKLVDDKGKMVGPEQQLSLDVGQSVEQVRFITINDYGGRVEATVDLGTGN